MISPLGQQEIDGVDIGIDGSLNLRPVPFPLFLDLIHPPAQRDGALPAMKRLFEFRTIRDDPAVHC